MAALASSSSLPLHICMYIYVHQAPATNARSGQESGKDERKAAIATAAAATGAKKKKALARVFSSLSPSPASICGAWGGSGRAWGARVRSPRAFGCARRQVVSWPGSSPGDAGSSSDGSGRCSTATKLPRTRTSWRRWPGAASVVAPLLLLLLLLMVRARCAGAGAGRASSLLLLLAAAAEGEPLHLPDDRRRVVGLLQPWEYRETFLGSLPAPTLPWRRRRMVFFLDGCGFVC